VSFSGLQRAGFFLGKIPHLTAVLFLELILGNSAWVKLKGYKMKMIKSFLACIPARVYAVALIALLGLFAAVPAHADTDIDGMVTSVTSLFTTVKSVIISIVGFLILLSVVVLVRRKR